MNQIIKEMWELYNTLIPEYEGKIFVPLSGGLDSRVLAGIISKRRKIDVGFCYYTEKTWTNPTYVRKLLKNLNYDKFEYINLVKHKKRNMIRAIDELSKMYNLKEYTIIIPVHMDVMTGLRKTKAADRKYYYSDSHNVEDGMDYTRFFKDVSTPFWNPRLVGYLQSLGYRQRFFQQSYRDMIKEYLPELWEVPRCYETGGPVRLDNYVIRRVINKVGG